MKFHAALLLLAAAALAQDALPDRAVARIGDARFFHPSGISGGAWSPDGTRVLLIAEDGSIRVWDALTGALLWKADSDGEGVSNAAFDATGTSVVRVARAAPPTAGPPEDEAGATLVVGRLDAATGGTPVTSTIDLRGVEPTLLAQSQGAVAAVGEGGQVMVFDLASGALRWARTSREADLESLAIAPDGVHLFLGGDSGVALLGKDGRVEWEDGCGGASVAAVAFSADGKLAAAGDEDGHLRVFDVATGTVPCDMVVGENSIDRLAISPDGATVVVADNGGWVRSCDIRSGTSTWSSNLAGDVAGFLGVSPDGKTVAVGASIGLARLLDAATGAARAASEGLGEAVTAITLSADGTRLLAGGAGGAVGVWERGAPVWREVDGGTRIAAMAIEEGGRETWLVADGVWHFHASDEPAPGVEPMDRIAGAGCVAISRDGRKAAIAVSGAVRLRGGPEGSPIRELTLPELKRPSQVVFSADGSLLAVAGTNADVFVLDVAAGTRVASITAFDAKQDASVQLAFSPDGRFLATDAWGRPVVWELASGTAARALELTTMSISALAFSTDGRTIAIGGMAGDVELYDFATGKLMRRVEGPLGGVTCLAFSADARRLAAGSEDATAWVWDMEGIVPALARDAKADLAASWEGLTTSDGAEAAGPMWALVAAGDEAVAFIAKRMEPAVVDAAGIADLVRRLDADEFEAREAAEAALSDLGPDAGPALREALAKSPSAEVRARAAKLLEVVGGLKLTSGASLRQARAVGTLERIGTRAAREELRRLAGGAPSARLTRDAKASLARMERRR